jgi:C4-dicarboxylate-specific signal transduction histidine kinase
VEALRDAAIRLRLAAPAGEPVEDSQFQAALESSRHPTLIVDDDDRICFANAAAAQLLQQSSERLVRSRAQEHLIAECPDHFGDEQPARLRTPPRISDHPPIFDVRLPDGRPVRAFQQTLFDRWKRRTHVCIELEERSASSPESTLCAVGRLAGELAHDINNQLSAALNYVFVLQRRLGRSDALASHLDELHGAAWQAAALADGLKLIGRRRSLEVEWLRLDEVLSTLAPLLRHLASDARIELRTERGLPRIRAPLAYIEQLIIMLVLSSLRRGSPGSTLTLRTGTVRTPADAIELRLSCELTDPYGLSAHALSARSSMKSTHGGLRRAIRHCRARLGHDKTRIWIDLQP